jgi:hypothetical protein
MTNNEIKVKLLRRARELIESRDQKYICLAVGEAARKDKRQARCASQLQDLIMGRLDYYGTLGAWLVSRGYEVWSDDDDGRWSSMEKLRRTRLAWIDSLIEEHSI